jgi:DNA-binding response OmpR family regulator
MKRKILIVEDDPKTAASIKLYLEHAGFETETASDGRKALDLFCGCGYDLIILDLMLPKINGLELCRLLRSDSAVPIIMLTARTTEEDKLRGLELGADDYVSKPFSPRELVARVRAVLRRAPWAQSADPYEIRFNDLVVDLRRREVRVGGEEVRLTPTEFRLLEVFARAPGRAFTRSELVERAFGWDYDGLERTVDAHVMKLRKKIGRKPGRPAIISTVFGVGYRLSEGRDDS